MQNVNDCFRKISRSPIPASTVPKTALVMSSLVTFRKQICPSECRVHRWFISDVPAFGVPDKKNNCAKSCFHYQPYSAISHQCVFKELSTTHAEVHMFLVSVRKGIVSPGPNIRCWCKLVVHVCLVLRFLFTSVRFIVCSGEAGIIF